MQSPKVLPKKPTSAVGAVKKGVVVGTKTANTKPTMSVMIAKTASALRKEKSSTIASAIRVLLYGNAKAGKTALAISAAQARNITQVIWLDAELGIDTIFNPSLNVPDWALDKVIPISCRDTVANPVSPITMARIVTATGAIQLCQEHGAVNCPCGNLIELDPTTWGKETLFVVDSLSQVSDMALLIADRITTKDNNGFAKYGEQGRMLSELLCSIQSAPYHSLVITHATVSEDSVTKKENVVPLCGTRAFSLKVGKYFSHVAYLSLETKKFKVGSSPTYKLNTLAGTRDGSKLEDTTDPSLVDIFERGEVT